jgi:hypothetical protein
MVDRPIAVRDPRVLKAMRQGSVRHLSRQGFEEFAYESLLFPPSSRHERLGESL